jgi:hypothetical protein
MEDIIALGDTKQNTASALNLHIPAHEAAPDLSAFNCVNKHINVPTGQQFIVSVSRTKSLCTITGLHLFGFLGLLLPCCRRSGLCRLARSRFASAGAIVNSHDLQHIIESYFDL